MLDRLHYQMHRFFDTCASGYSERIDLERINFVDILDSVQRRQYHCKVPACLAKLVRQRERKPGMGGRPRRHIKGDGAR